MGLGFNDSGLVTMGLGIDHKLCTIGMGMKFEFGGYPLKRQKIKEYSIELLLPIQKEGEEELIIKSPVEIRSGKELLISLSVSKEINTELNLITEVNYTQLFNILDEI